MKFIFHWILCYPVCICWLLFIFLLMVFHIFYNFADSVISLRPNIKESEIRIDNNCICINVWFVLDLSLLSLFFPNNFRMIWLRIWMQPNANNARKYVKQWTHMWTSYLCIEIYRLHIGVNTATTAPQIDVHLSFWFVLNCLTPLENL